MIRPADITDAAAIAAVERAAASHPWSERAVRDTLAQPTGFGLVVVDGGEIVAHLLGSAVLDEGELLTVAVLPSHRRRGLARSLHTEAAVVWSARGATSVFLEVRVDNAGAIALYKAEGWQPCGRRRGYYHDGADALLFRLELKDASPIQSDAPA